MGCVLTDAMALVRLWGPYLRSASDGARSRERRRMRPILSQLGLELGLGPASAIAGPRVRYASARLMRD